MNEQAAGPFRTPRSKNRIRLRFLVAGLTALLVVYVVLGLASRFPGYPGGAGLPCDRCITEQSVLKFLDGKTVFSGGSMRAAGSGLETTTLHKENISSLVFRPDDWSSILVRFNLDHEGKQYRVEGSFQFTTSDSPELHYHGWDRFMGQVVSGR